MIKDIISFANTTHTKDCFLIFGAEDNGQPHEMVMPRRNQNQLLGLLNRVPQWAGHNQPIVSLEDIVIEGHVYDIVIIYNSNRTPFYLQEDCVPEIKYPKNASPQQKKEVDDQKKRKTLRQGVIYVRTADNSTPFGDIANPFIIEQLWKKRFHLLQPVLRQFMEEMRITDNWQETEGEKYHNIYRPEFTFQFREEESPQAFNEFYVSLFQDQKAYGRTYTCNYYGTVLCEVYTVSIDGGRWQIPYPKITLLGNHQRYFYLVQDSDDMVIYNFLNSHNTTNTPERYLRVLVEYVPLFVNETEHLSFEQWIQDHQDELELECSKNKIRNTNRGDNHFIHDKVVGRSISYLLQQFRQLLLNYK